MNIKFPKVTAEKFVSIYSILWIFLTFSVSIFFSFFMYPTIVEEANSATVFLSFKTKDPGGDYGPGNWYMPNKPLWRQKYMDSSVEKDQLFFSACQLLPLSQKPICDTGRNWRRVSLIELGCGSLEDCERNTHRISGEQRHEELTGMKPTSGTSLSLADVASLSFSEPTTWGKYAGFPIFLILVFLGIKLGRTLGEFLFKPYSGD